MIDTVQHQAENHPAWEDWEDDGGFDDEEALMEFKSLKARRGSPQERTGDYEKRDVVYGIVVRQMSFLEA